MKNKFIKSLIFFLIFVLEKKNFSSENLSQKNENVEPSIQAQIEIKIIEFEKDFTNALKRHTKLNQSFVDTLNEKSGETFKKTAWSLNKLAQTLTFDTVKFNNNTEKIYTTNRQILLLLEASSVYLKGEFDNYCTFKKEYLQTQSTITIDEQTQKSLLEKQKEHLNKIFDGAKGFSIDSKLLNNYRKKLEALELTIQNKYQNTLSLLKNSKYHKYMEYKNEQSIIEDFIKEYFKQVILKEPLLKETIKEIQNFDTKNIDNSLKKIVELQIKGCNNIGNIKLDSKEFIFVFLQEIKKTKEQDDKNKEQKESKQKNGNEEQIKANDNNQKNNILDTLKKENLKPQV